jgi:predicted peroxiredoxin/TusA-related sulfurtransferase
MTTSAALDGRGKSITTFVVYQASRRLESMTEGQVLEILTDDYEPFTADITAWCRATGHRLVETEPTADGLRFLVEKGAPKAKEKKLAMVISTDGLEELLSPLGFALAAALEGLEAHLFFQGPAVHVLAKGFRPKLQGWSRPFSRFAATEMSKTGHIPAQAKLEQLRVLGARLYVCGPSMEHFKVSKEQLLFDDLKIVEYLTFMSIMEKADIHLYL